MFVSERPDGLKQVDYGRMAHAEAKGSQATADKAYAAALAALEAITADAPKKKSSRKEAR